MHALPIKSEVVETEHLELVAACMQVAESKNLMVILLVLVLIEIGTIKVEQTVRKFVAGYSFYLKICLVLLNELKSGQTSCKATTRLVQHLTHACHRP